ncbi:MAG: two-component sensor histidine kinase [Phycisphaerales bacterium]|nr:MAG: two-component sensor histidine kinase [Phycisphaerales bacterium]
MAWTTLAIGICVGLLLGAPLTWLLATRLARRARAAERRARDAQRLAEIGAMTGGLAHEIKNPLSSIGLNAQLLGEAIAELPVDDDDRTRLARRIGALRREVDRLRDILADFLRFAGALRLERREADVRGVVEEIADFFAPQAEQAGVRVRVDLAAEPLIASVDAPHLKQALLNLMLNAMQAMTDAKTGAPPVAPRELMLRVEPGRDEPDRVCRVHVIDTGPGIPADKADKVFTPYFTTKSGGSGLGLPIARRIVEEHGGRIDVHSEPGRGTDFAITLPLASPE